MVNENKIQSKGKDYDKELQEKIGTKEYLIVKFRKGEWERKRIYDKLKVLNEKLDTLLAESNDTSSITTYDRTPSKTKTTNETKSEFAEDINWDD